MALYVDGLTADDRLDQDYVTLAPNVQSVVELTWDADLQGTHILLVVVDPYDVLDESNETNNNESYQITVRALPDFSIEDDDIVAANDNPVEGANVTFTVRVNNDGSLEGDCEVLVYVDGSVNNPIYQGTVAVDGGDYEELTVYWPSAVGGNHIIHVELDPDDDVDEVSESNNDASISIDVARSGGGEETDNTGLMIAVVILGAGVAATAVIWWRRRWPN